MIFGHLLAVPDPEPHDAALNMAIDETLLRCASAPMLRLYRWARPAVSFGYFGKWTDAARAWPGREMVRRWTGGGIVPHGEDFTYSLIVPRAHPFFSLGPGESYCAIHECVARALGGATLAGENPPPVSAACFENPVAHDVLVENRKVAGAAQRRSACGLLHQGSIQGATISASALAEAFSPQVSHAPLLPDILPAALRLAREKYASDLWTRRR